MGQAKQSQTVTLRMTQGGTVQGTVLDATGAVISENVIAALYDLEGNYVAFTFVNTDGTYVLDCVPTGTYDLLVSSGSYLFESVAVSVTEGVAKTVNISAIGGMVSGIIKDPSGTPLANFPG